MMSAFDSEGSSLEVLWEDGERIFCRTRVDDADGNPQNAIVVLPAAEHPTPASLDRLRREYELKDQLDSSWAVRPLDLVHDAGRALLMLEDTGSEPLSRLLGAPMEVGRFLPLAIDITIAIGKLHQRGIVHKDIKPANILVNGATGEVRLTGFGIASRLARERQMPHPPETIAGTLAYMAPEQTGRMNRSIDSRSDLYALGVTFYQMLTGGLPFAATDPMEWVHCHLARPPVAPVERLKKIPGAVSAIVMKLLAKSAEDRYQTAAGLERDLRRGQTEWEAQARIDDFPLGKKDTPDRLLIPEKLYGRESEVKTLLAAFDRIVAGGRPELVLVSGYSGIGKSAVVNELHKPLVPPRGLFASGKFDQYKRDIPYATLAQAFQSLIRPLLSKSEDELRKWRDALHEALDPNGALVVELVPELKHIIGEQPPVPELPLQDAQARFLLIFRRFISVFACPEHPLALFLDDLQWLDAATLDLLEDLLSRTDMKHLLLIGAYRDNEVDPAHPLMRKLDAMRHAGSPLQDIVLAPLGCEDLGQLLSDSLHCGLDRAAPLAQLIHDKTAGNPFFTVQFISTLADEGLLTFDHHEAHWSWDLSRIHAKDYTDNVVDLMVRKLNRLPVDTQKALQQFACMGNSAEFDTLQIVYEDSIEEMHSQLWEAVRAGLVFRSEKSYRFLHDRVQEAAYSLIPKELRAEAHLRIGSLLAENTSAEKLEDAIFEIVNQLNRGSHLITSVEERERVAELNLIAGRRAKISTAYASALKYLRACGAILTDTTWELNYQLIFSIEYLMAECELLTADMTASESRLSMLSQRAKNRHDFAVVTRLQLTLYTTLDQSDRGVDVFLEYLRRAGTNWVRHPTHDEVRNEYDRIWTLVGDSSIEQLVDLPLMTDADVLDMLDVLTEIVTPALYYDENLSSLVVCRMVNLSLQYGNCDGSCFAYVWFGVIAGPRFNNYKDGFRFGQLGFELVERCRLTRYQARTYMSFGNFVVPWTRHVATGSELVRRAFDAAYRIGDLTFAAYSLAELVKNSLMAGRNLAEVQTEAENALEFAKQTRFGLVIEVVAAQLGLIRMLRGLTSDFGSLNDGEFDELASEHRLTSNPVLAFSEFCYLTRKLQARFFAGDYVAAVDASKRAHSFLWPVASQIETGEFRFYGGLAHAALWRTASPDERHMHFEALMDHHAQLKVWAENCPTNFENREALIAAEIAQIEGRILDSEEFYENAIRSARLNGFIHNEAVANELAAQFYRARSFKTIADAYLRNARDCYRRWGADGKVRQLDRLYPHLAASRGQPAAAIIGSPVEDLDAASVVKASQALSSEIELPKLIERLMTITLVNAGADRGLLILPSADKYLIHAEARATRDQIEVILRQEPINQINCPESLIRHVIRTRESVILDDASNSKLTSADHYLCDRQSKSILCLPLLKQGQLTGILLLENTLSSYAFTAARIAVLELLAAQAAISLENTRLYGDLQEREAKVRRLVDSNIIGIVIGNPDGHVQEANQAFLRIIGYEHADLEAGQLRRSELTPPEWHDRDARAVAEMRATGTAQPFEKEYFRKDGSRVPVLVGGATLDECGDTVVIFVIDLTERRYAEAAMRESELRYREVLMELAHANRVATMGQLSASIAHEINQPLSGIVTNASTCLRMLQADPPNVMGAQETARRSIRDANRATDIVSRLRALYAKRETSTGAVDLNEASHEVISLFHRELQNSRINLRSEFAEHLPLVQGDRIQLQQVLMNLIRNAADAMSDVDDRPRQLIVRTAKAESDGVLVTVQDSGPGIDPTIRERIFDAFYTSKADGLGMGLSICRTIIEAHGGKLWATAALPYGAIFQFTLPVINDTVHYSR